MTKPVVKRIKPEKVAVIHHCTQEDRVKRIELILVGNGHPEDGYVYKVIEMSKAIREINDHITGISGIVKELHEESIGKNAVKDTRKYNFEKLLKILGVLLAAGMLVIGYYNLHKQSEMVKEKINNIGIPMVMDKRGNILALPDSAKIKYMFNDSLNFTIKRNE